MNTHPKDFCTFCWKKTKISGMSGTDYCPNGHYVVDDNTYEVEESRPVSVGTKIQGSKIYRLKSMVGAFCNKKGELIQVIHNENNKVNNM